MAQTKKRYNHMYTIAFEVQSDHPAEQVQEHEILSGLAGRLQDLIAHKGLIREAVGEPDDTVDNVT
jgi:hypothetical protein